MDHLDQFDRKLLDLLKHDSRRTGERLSELVGLSPAACLRRVQRLRRTGAIQREVAIIDPKLEDRGTTIIMLLRIDHQSPRLMDEFCHRLRRLPEVERLVWVTGDDDIVLVLGCASMARFTEFCEAHLNDAPARVSDRLA